MYYIYLHILTLFFCIYSFLVETLYLSIVADLLKEPNSSSKRVPYFKYQLLSIFFLLAFMSNHICTLIALWRHFQLFGNPHILCYVKNQ